MHNTSFKSIAQAACLLCAIGCAPGGVREPDSTTKVQHETVLLDAASEGNSTPAAPLKPDDTWDAIYLKGAKLGYVHTVREPIEEQGKQLWRTTILHHLETPRFNDVAVQESRVVSVETESGGLIRYESESQLGAAPVKSTGEVVGDRLNITTTIGGDSRSTHLPWDAAHDGGFDAIAKSVLRQPLAPGERRTLRAMTSGLDQPLLATFHLTARDWEEIAIGDAKQRLLRVELKQILPGAEPLESVAWLNESGESLKMELMPGMFAVRTTQAVAMAAPTGEDSPKFDIGFDTIVRLDAAVGNLHQARLVRYRVTLPKGEPAKQFARGGSQSVVETGDPEVAEITVRAMRPGDNSADDQPPAADDKAANLLIQSEDPLIKELAAQAIGDATTTADKTARIEKFVHNYMQQANFSQAFATATEVAKSRRGDCTEFAVLTAAIARAAGIPARVAIGLVYMHSAGPPGFGFHMWNELYVDGHWIPYDATLGLGGIGGGHLKLSDSHLSDGAALAKLIPVVQVMNRLKIEVESVE